MSRRRFLRYAGLAGLTLLSGGPAPPLFGSGSNQTGADQSHNVYLPLITRIPPIPPLSQELVQEAYQFYALGDPVPPTSLRFEFKSNLNNPEQPSIIFARDPGTNEIVLATRLNLQTQDLEWHVAKLRDLADAVGLRIGTALSAPYFSEEVIRRHDELVIDNFNHATINVYKDSIVKEEKRELDFRKMQDAIDLAERHNMTIEAGELLYGASDFTWTDLKQYKDFAQQAGFLDLLQQIDLGEFMYLNDEQRTVIIEQIIDQIEDLETRNQVRAMRQELRAKTISFVRDMISRFREKANTWRVVNEYDINPGLWDPYFFLVGPDYVDVAFETARGADPDTKLTINPQGVPSIDDYGYIITLPVVRRLEEKGLIDYVGDQEHVNASTPPHWETVWDTLATYGVPAYPSEVDVNLKDITGSDEERFNLQADTYLNLFRAAIRAGVRLIVFHECFGDKYNWLERMDVPGQSSPNADPTLFDDNLDPKPAYFALKTELQAMVDQE